MSQTQLLRTPVVAANLLSAFNTVPQKNLGLAGYINSIFSPALQVTQQNCGTLVGLQVPIATAYSYIGYTLVSGGTLTSSIINSDFSAGIPYVYVRTISTCTASGGLCQTCLSSSGITGTVGSSVILSFPDRSPLVNYLAGTYSGSLFRLAVLPGTSGLPIRRQLYTSLVSSQLNLIYLEQIKTDPTTAAYLKGLQDPFEQFLCLALIYVLS